MSPIQSHRCSAWAKVTHFLYWPMATQRGSQVSTPLQVSCNNLKINWLKKASNSYVYTCKFIQTKLRTLTIRPKNWSKKRNTQKRKRYLAADRVKVLFVAVLHVPVKQQWIWFRNWQTGKKRGAGATFMLQKTQSSELNEVQGGKQ